MVEDKLLLWRCKLGRRDAFRRIYEKYEGDLKTLAASLLDCRTDAEDVVQDVFLSFLHSVEELHLRSSLKAYLTCCVANKSRDYIRKRHRQRTTEMDMTELMTSNTHGPLQLVANSEAIHNVVLAVQQLPRDHREAVVLRLHGEMKFKTIARLQNVSTKTAHGRYRQGLETLRSILGSEVEK